MSERIQIFDERFYKIDGRFYPSVTYILDSYPKSSFFHSWLKEMGEDADVVRDRAGERGSRVHTAIQDLLTGVKIQYNAVYWSEREQTNIKLSDDEWRHLITFVDWWKNRTPKLAGTERIVYSKEHSYAGTADAFLSIDGILTLADWKTSKAIYATYPMQVAAYAKAVEEMTNHVFKQGIILRTGTKHKDGFCEQILTKDDLDREFDHFLRVKNVWDIEHGKKSPNGREVPSELSIEIEEFNLEEL